MCVPRIKKIKCSWLLAFKMNLALKCHELPHLCRLLCNCQSACCPWRTSLCHRVLVIWWQLIKLWGKCDMPMATTCYNKECCGKTLCPNKSWEIWCILSATGSRIMPLAEGSLVCGSGLPASLCPRHKGQVQGHKNFRFAQPCPTFECKPFQRKSATLYLQSFGAAHLSVQIPIPKVRRAETSRACWFWTMRAWTEPLSHSESLTRNNFKHLKKAFVIEGCWWIGIWMHFEGIYLPQFRTLPAQSQRLSTLPPTMPKVSGTCLPRFCR